MPDLKEKLQMVVFIVYLHLVPQFGPHPYLANCFKAETGKTVAFGVHLPFVLKIIQMRRKESVKNPSP
ncbi:hypothetical protein [Marinobacter salinus]|uniref:hypothetical protein n=1 Tax=Marinobacter salinus TaxID=1874317 RepID=UPI0012FE0792|nr:hypothetical protein [Marinobacter salinus]